MAEVKLQLGAEVDIASGAEVQSAVSTILGDKPKPPRVSTRRLISALVTPTPLPALASIDLTFQTGGVPVGQIWDMRRLTVVGTDDHTPIANVFAALAIGDTPDLINLSWHGQSVPLTQVFGAHTALARSFDRFFVRLTGSGVAAAQSYLAVASVVVVEDTPEAEATL